MGRLPSSNLIFLWMAQSTSVFGDMLTFLALPMLVYEATGSKAALSMAIFVRGIPTLLLGPVGGALADRMDRKTLMVASDILRGLLILPILMVGSDGLVNTIYAMVALKAVVSVFFQPAMASVLPSLVDRDRLIGVNSCFSLTFQLLQFIAPLIGSAILLKYDLAILLWVDLASFMLSAFFLMLIKLPPRKGNKSSERKSVAHDIREGLQIIRHSPMLLVLLLTAVITSFGQGFISPAWLPYIVEILGQPQESFGILVSLQGGGAMVGSVILLVWGLRKQKKLKPFHIAFLLGSGFTIFMQVTTLNFYIFLIWGTLVGIFIAGRGVTSQTLQQHATPQSAMGRVSSTFQVLSQGAMLSAVLLVSLDLFNTRQLFLLACSLWLVGCLLGALLMLKVEEKEPQTT